MFMGIKGLHNCEYALLSVRAKERYSRGVIMKSLLIFAVLIACTYALLKRGSDPARKLKVRHSKIVY